MIKRGKKKIISVILTAALVFTTVFGAGFAYAGSSVSGFTGTTYTHNSRFNDRILIHGVDVSTYQNGIDWKRPVLILQLSESDSADTEKQAGCSPTTGS